MTEQLPFCLPENWVSLFPETVSQNEKRSIFSNKTLDLDFFAFSDAANTIFSHEALTQLLQYPNGSIFKSAKYKPIRAPFCRAAAVFAEIGDYSVGIPLEVVPDAFEISDTVNVHNIDGITSGSAQFSQAAAIIKETLRDIPEHVFHMQEIFDLTKLFGTALIVIFRFGQKQKLADCENYLKELSRSSGTLNVAIGCQIHLPGYFLSSLKSSSPRGSACYSIFHSQDICNIVNDRPAFLGNTAYKLVIYNTIQHQRRHLVHFLPLQNQNVSNMVNILSKIEQKSAEISESISSFLNNTKLRCEIYFTFLRTMEINVFKNVLLNFFQNKIDIVKIPIGDVRLHLQMARDRLFRYLIISSQKITITNFCISIWLYEKYVSGVFCYDQIVGQERSTGFFINQEHMEPDLSSFTDQFFGRLPDLLFNHADRIVSNPLTLTELRLLVSLLLFEEPRLSERVRIEVLNNINNYIVQIFQRFESQLQPHDEIDVSNFLSTFKRTHFKTGVTFLCLQRMISWNQSNDVSIKNLYKQIEYNLLRRQQSYTINKNSVFLGKRPGGWDLESLLTFVNRYDLVTLSSILKHRTSQLLESLKNDLRNFGEYKPRKIKSVDFERDHDAFARVLLAKMFSCYNCKKVVNVLEIIGQKFGVLKFFWFIFNLLPNLTVLKDDSVLQNCRGWFTGRTKICECINANAYICSQLMFFTGLFAVENKINVKATILGHADLPEKFIYTAVLPLDHRLTLMSSHTDNPFCSSETVSQIQTEQTKYNEKERKFFLLEESFTRQLNLPTDPGFDSIATYKIGKQKDSPKKACKTAVSSTEKHKTKSKQFLKPVQDSRKKLIENAQEAKIVKVPNNALIFSDNNLTAANYKTVSNNLNDYSKTHFLVFNSPFNLEGSDYVTNVNDLLTETQNIEKIKIENEVTKIRKHITSEELKISEAFSKSSSQCIMENISVLNVSNVDKFDDSQYIEPAQRKDLLHYVYDTADSLTSLSQDSDNENVDWPQTNSILNKNNSKTNRSITSLENYWYLADQKAEEEKFWDFLKAKLSLQTFDRLPKDRINHKHFKDASEDILIDFFQLKAKLDILTAITVAEAVRMYFEKQKL